MKFLRILLAAVLITQTPVSFSDHELKDREEFCINDFMQTVEVFVKAAVGGMPREELIAKQKEFEKSINISPAFSETTKGIIDAIYDRKDLPQKLVDDYIDQCMQYNYAATHKPLKI